MEIELYDGLTFTLPKLPPKKDILFSTLQKKKQKWRRPELPEDFDTWSKIRQKETIDQWWEWRNNGLWFMNNGEPTYITGSHFMYLISEFDYGVPQYRRPSRDRFYMRELVKKDSSCAGLLELKFRRAGVTSEEIASMLDDITKNYQVHGGIISKTAADAKAAFIVLSDVFNTWPAFFKPVTKGKDDKVSRLDFRAPGKTTLSKKQLTQGANTESLQSWIDWKGTTKAGYDSQKLFRALFDEGGKFEKVDFAEFVRVNKTCVMTGAKVFGKVFMPSTIDDNNNSNMEGYRTIWHQSNPSEKNKNNRTKSGFYRMFTPAYDGYEGYIDEYGNSVIDTPTPEQRAYLKTIDECPDYKIGAKEYLLNERADLEGNALEQHRRQYPFTEEEAFRLESKDCLFDAEKINDRIGWLEGIYPKPYAEGNLVWSEGKNSEVIWSPCKGGRFLMSVTGVPAELQNRVSRINGRYTPMNTANYVVAVDPFKYSKVLSGKGSKGAAYGFRLYDPNIDLGKQVREWQTNQFVMEYVSRPEIEVFYDDMVKMCCFLGCKMLLEQNVNTMELYFEMEGYSNFLMERPKILYSPNLTNKTNAQATGANANMPTKQTMATLIDSYIATDIYGSGRDHGHCCLVNFPRLLKDWLQFKIEDSTEFDAGMAGGWTLVAANRWSKPKRQSTSMELPFRTYNKKG